MKDLAVKSDTWILSYNFCELPSSTDEIQRGYALIVKNGDGVEIVHHEYWQPAPLDSMFFALLDGIVHTKKWAPYIPSGIVFDHPLMAAVFSVQLSLWSISCQPAETQPSTAPLALHYRDTHREQTCACCGRALESVNVCGQCKAVLYCGRECQKRAWKLHKPVCESHIRAMGDQDALAVLPFAFAEQSTQNHFSVGDYLNERGLHLLGLWRRECDCFNFPYGRLPRNSSMYLPEEQQLHTLERSETAVTRVPANWEEYYSMFGLARSSPVAFLLSFPLTVAHMLSTFHPSAIKSAIAENRAVVIHFLGPEKELDQSSLLSQLVTLFPLVSFDIHLIGPLVPETLDGRSESLCEGKLRLSYVNAVYDPKLVLSRARPDVVVCLNASLGAYPAWGEAIAAIKEHNLPALFSDNNRYMAELGEQMLTEGAELPLSVPMSINPFRRPARQTVSLHRLPVYENAYIYGVNTDKL